MAALDVHKDRIMVALAERECAILTAVVSGKTLSGRHRQPISSRSGEFYVYISWLYAETRGLDVGRDDQPSRSS